MSLQVLEEFLVMLGVKADTEKVKSFGDALTKVGSIATVVVGALKTVSLAAWAFADGYVRRAEELYKANSSLFKITKEQVEMSKKYEDGMGRLGKIIESVKIKVAFGFLPTMLEMVNTFNEFLDANKDLIANGITKLLEVVSKLSQVINNTVRFIVKIIEATIGWKGALIVLIGVFVWLKRAMLLAFVTNPIFWVIAAVGILMLLIDDFMTYLDGGESQFGNFWGKMIKWINTAKEKWKGFSDSAKSSIKAVMVMLGMLASSSVVIKVMTTVFTVLGAAIKVLTSPITNLIKIVTMLGKAFLVMGRFLMANPLFLVAAIIAGIIYVIYDLIKWLKTGQSSFGGFWDYLAGVFNKIKAKFIEVKDGAINTFKSMIQSLKDMAGNIFDAITSPFLKAFNWIADKFGSLGSLISGAVSGARNLVGMGGAAAVSNTVNSGGNMTVNAPINIASNNPMAAGRAVKAAVTNASNVALRNTNSKVKN